MAHKDSPIERRIKRDARKLRAEGRSFEEIKATLEPKTGVENLERILEDFKIEDQTRGQEVLLPLQNSSIAVNGPFEDWYRPEVLPDGCWTHYKTRLENSQGMRNAVPAIDDESTVVVSLLANPFKKGTKKKGLVLGYVQSGKTANYAAVIAKAVDAGYRMVIVMAGMYTALRQQTQQRLERDLETDRAFVPSGTVNERRWYLLTEGDSQDSQTQDMDVRSDITNIGTFMSSDDTRFVFLAVTKKNSSRMKHLVKFLKNMRKNVKERFPVLIIDDESDQATPNTLAEKEDVSAINAKMRSLWAEVSTGAYVAYTATPFANLLMDPNEDREMYPSDFFLALNKPDGYLGSREYFGLREAGLSYDSNPTLDAVRVIPKDEVSCIEPKKKKGTQPLPSMVPSLEKAIRWFIIATAIRRFRGHNTHSTMLVHTSMKTSSHSNVAFLISEYVEQLRKLRKENHAGFTRLMKSTFEDEFISRSDDMSTPSPTWSQISNRVETALDDLHLIIDNSQSDERLTYDVDAADTTIVVGGNTLSRGLTLEGLVVSYFARVSQTADTLLQMGRWFGYRPGYDDLVRVWLSDKVREKFTFILDIEAELRDEAQNYVDRRETPADIAVRMRTYPGVVELTARNKMFFADSAGMSLQGTRLQTYIFDTDGKVIRKNWNIASRFVDRVHNRAQRISKNRNHTIFHDIKSGEILEFLEAFEVHPDLPSLQMEGIGRWIEEYAMDLLWNVVLVSPAYSERVNIGHFNQISLSRRSASNASTPNRTNIRALIGPGDLALDLPHVDPNWSIRETINQRKELVDGRGIFLLYLIDKDSTPNDETSLTRKNLDLVANVPLFGLVPPFIPDNRAQDGDYVSVRIDQHRTGQETDDE